MSFSVVPRLEEIAFVVSLENIVSKLLACNDYHPGENKRPVKVLHSSRNLLDSRLSRENVIDGIRKSLSYHLIGRVGVKVRQQYLKYYFNEEFLSKYETNVPHPWMVLDCVLDESFKKLNEPVSLHLDLNENDEKVIPTIAHRSSQLEKLEISFEYSTFPMATVEKFGGVIQSLSSLSNLTSLTLIDLPEFRRSVLKFVGKSCPLLSTFRLLGSIHTTTRDFVALILGERDHEFFPMDPNDYDYLSREDLLKLENMVVPNEMLTPICSNLQNLYLIERSRDDLKSGLVFALRHLPQLRKVDGTSSLPAAIKILYASLEAENVEAAISSPCNFSDMTTLSLTVIEDLNVVPMDEELFRLIGQKCPHLKEVSFNQEYSNESPNRIQISLLYLGNVLKNEWPKLDSVIFVLVAPEFVRLILEMFGPSLQHLKFVLCDDVDLLNLLPCTRLKSLLIMASSSTTSLAKGIPSLKLRANEFLPKLEIIETDCCLGHWSRLFEENSGLTSVSLPCCHIGTSASIYPDCNTIPEIWPHLEKLVITDKCSDVGFTIPMISAIISRLPNLKEIRLPIRFQPSCSRYLRRYFWVSNPLFIHFAAYNPCPYVCSFLLEE